MTFLSVPINLQAVRYLTDKNFRYQTFIRLSYVSQNEISGGGGAGFKFSQRVFPYVTANGQSKEMFRKTHLFYSNDLV